MIPALVNGSGVLAHVLAVVEYNLQSSLNLRDLAALVIFLSSDNATLSAAGLTVDGEVGASSSRALKHAEAASNTEEEKLSFKPAAGVAIASVQHPNLEHATQTAVLEIVNGEVGRALLLAQNRAAPELKWRTGKRRKRKVVVESLAKDQQLIFQNATLNAVP